jgi:hypothetical protein
MVTPLARHRRIGTCSPVLRILLSDIFDVSLFSIFNTILTSIGTASLHQELFSCVYRPCFWHFCADIFSIFNVLFASSSFSCLQEADKQ